MVAEDYFSRVAEDVFAATLLALGARKVLANPLCVRFVSIDWFVELIALHEDGPRYSPRVEIGPLPEISKDARDQRVDVMHCVPDGSSLRRYNIDWRYQDSDEMFESFIRVRDEIFKPYAIPFLVDQLSLVRLVKARSKAIEIEWAIEISEHNDAVYRAKAKAAMSAKDYREYIVCMSRISVERQTESERKRVAFSAKKIES